MAVPAFNVGEHIFYEDNNNDYFLGYIDTVTPGPPITYKVVYYNHAFVIPPNATNQVIANGLMVPKDNISEDKLTARDNAVFKIDPTYGQLNAALPEMKNPTKFADVTKFKTRTAMYFTNDYEIELYDDAGDMISKVDSEEFRKNAFTKTVVGSVQRIKNLPVKLDYTVGVKIENNVEDFKDIIVINEITTAAAAAAPAAGVPAPAAVNPPVNVADFIVKYKDAAGADQTAELKFEGNEYVYFEVNGIKYKLHTLKTDTKLGGGNKTYKKKTHNQHKTNKRSQTYKHK